MEPLLVSIIEAARILAVSQRTIYYMIDDGRLDSVSLGRRRLIKIASLRQVAGAA